MACSSGIHIFPHVPTGLTSKVGVGLLDVRVAGRSRARDPPREWNKTASSSRQTSQGSSMIFEGGCQVWQGRGGLAVWKEGLARNGRAPRLERGLRRKAGNERQGRLILLMCFASVMSCLLRLVARCVDRSRHAQSLGLKLWLALWEVTRHR